MPGKSPYRIELNDADRQELKTARPLIYVAVSGRRTSQNDAAGGHRHAQRRDRRTAGYRREIVSKWRKRFFEQGLAGLDELPRTGRPGVFPP